MACVPLPWVCKAAAPVLTVDNDTIHNNPFGPDGLSLDPDYAQRLDTLIRGADACGMVVIVSYFYGTQTQRLPDGLAVRNAVRTASNFLRDGAYSNVLIEVANEHDVPQFIDHPLVYYPEGVAALINLAQEESGGLPVGCSGRGGSVYREIAEASDYILIHGNGCTRQRLYNMIKEVRSWDLNKPIVCNEDSQAIGQMAVTYRHGVSWGYYNNMTKQEPPADWGITPGEDTFFAYRMAQGIGIETPALTEEDQYYLQGFEPNMTDGGERWIRLASLYPENINCVEFYRNGEWFETAYDEPFSVNYISNWRQGGYPLRADDKEFKALIHLRDGRILERVVNL